MTKDEFKNYSLAQTNWWITYANTKENKERTKFRDNEISLIGNIHAVVCDSFDEGMSMLKSDIIRWMAPLLEYGAIMSDFTLVYSSDDIENNRVWASTSVVYWESFD